MKKKLYIAWASFRNVIQYLSSLLQAATFEVLLVRMACLFDTNSSTMMFTNGKLFRRQTTGVGDLLVNSLDINMFCLLILSNYRSQTIIVDSCHRFIVISLNEMNVFDQQEQVCHSYL